MEVFNLGNNSFKSPPPELKRNKKDIPTQDRGFTLRGLVLNESGFEDVFKALKVKKMKLIRARHDDGLGNFVCFITKDKAVLEFWSSDFAGSGKDISRIGFFGPGHKPGHFDKNKCPEISLDSNALEFKNGTGLKTKRKFFMGFLEGR